jgi:fatty acid desaturase
MQKKTQKTNYTALTVTGLLLMALGFIYQTLNLAGNLISLMFINAGIIMLVISTLKYNKLGAGVEQDEMTRKISSQTLSYSWLLTFATLNIVFWLDYSDIIVLEIQPLLGFLIFLMIFSSALFKKIIFKYKL